MNISIGIDIGGTKCALSVGECSSDAVKILHREEGGLVLYALRIEMGRMRMPFSGEPDEIACSFGHADLISAARSALESPYVRRIKMLSKSL